MVQISSKTKARIDLLSRQLLSCLDNLPKPGENISFAEGLEKVFSKQEPEEVPVVDTCTKVLLADVLSEKSKRTLTEYYAKFARGSAPIEYNTRPRDWASWAHIVQPFDYVEPLFITEYTKKIIRRINMTNLKTIMEISNTPIFFPKGVSEVPLLVTVLRTSKRSLMADAGWRVTINKATRQAMIANEIGVPLHRPHMEAFFCPVRSTKYAKYYIFTYAQYALLTLWKNRQISLLDTVQNIRNVVFDSFGKDFPLTSVLIVVVPNRILFENAMFFESFLPTLDRKSNIIRGITPKGVTYKDFFSYEDFFHCGRKYIKSSKEANPCADYGRESDVVLEAAAPASPGEAIPSRQVDTSGSNPSRQVDTSDSNSYTVMGTSGPLVSTTYTVSGTYVRTSEGANNA